MGGGAAPHAAPASCALPGAARPSMRLWHRAAWTSLVLVVVCTAEGGGAVVCPELDSQQARGER